MDARQSPIYDVAQVVGLVQQNPEAQFCTLTVRDEVAFGLENRCLPRDEIRERMDWAFSIVGAGHLRDRMLASLSGGEKQKVAIAAMMAAKPQVLMFDEPTSNLDPAATAEIFQVIEHIQAKAGITVIVIEHKVEYLRRFGPRLVAMDDGCVVYDGPMPETARNQPPVTPRPTGPVLGEPLVMGDNGSGKTTFLHCLLGLRQPSRGCVEVIGRDTRQAAVSELARQVGFVFQNPDHQLFADSVWEEATFAPRNFGEQDADSEVRVGELVARCGLGDRLQDHPYRLSYGQKRRLNLISVLSYQPALILLDEVLIGQDPANAAFLLGLLQDHVSGGGAVIMVNHAPGITRRYASRLLFLDSGKIIIDAPNGQAFEQLTSLGREAYVA
jgi:energy-coupling factor transport system ATP-binding protein